MANASTGQHSNAREAKAMTRPSLYQRQGSIYDISDRVRIIAIKFHNRYDEYDCISVIGILSYQLRGRDTVYRLREVTSSTYMTLHMLLRRLSQLRSESAPNSPWVPSRQSGKHYFKLQLEIIVRRMDEHAFDI